VSTQLNKSDEHCGVVDGRTSVAVKSARF